MTTKLNLLVAAATLLVIAGCDSNSNSAFIDPGFTGGGGGGGGGGGAGGGTGGGGTGNEPTVVFSPNQVNGLGKALLSGDARRISFLDDSDPLGTNPGTDWQVWSYNLGLNAPVQLTPDTTTDISPSTGIDATDSGDFVYFAANDDFTGSNPNNRVNVFRAAADGTDIRQLTDVVGQGLVREVVASGDGSLIAFQSDHDLTGGNPGLSIQIFTVDSNGNNLTQLTNGNFAPQQIAISDDGSLISFFSGADPFGLNADQSREIFIVNSDGSNLTQLTSTMGDSWGPKLSDDGSLVLFLSTGDLVPGSNADGSSEVFVGRTNLGGFTQISSSAADSGGLCCSAPRISISGDGNYVAFISNGDLAGLNPNADFTVFWANSTGGAVTQLLRPGIVPDSVTNYSASDPSLDNTGSTIAFTSSRNFTSETQDSNDKIYTAVRQ